jgi:hypothetical protein
MLARSFGRWSASQLGPAPPFASASRAVRGSHAAVFILLAWLDRIFDRTDGALVLSTWSWSGSLRVFRRCFSFRLCNTTTRASLIAPWVSANFFSSEAESCDCERRSAVRVYKFWRASHHFNNPVPICLTSSFLTKYVSFLASGARSRSQSR